MRPKFIEIDLDDVDTDGVCASQTTAGAGNLVINGAKAVTYFDGMPRASRTVAELDVARQLNITSDGNDSGNTFTVTGIDALGRTASESVTGPNATTVETLNYYKVVTQIAIDGATVGNITVGFVDEAAVVVPLDFYSDAAARVDVNINGTINFTVQETFNDIFGSNAGSLSDTQFLWQNITALASKTADTTGTASANATAIQLLVNSYTNTAEIRMQVVQPGRQC